MSGPSGKLHSLPLLNIDITCRFWTLLGRRDLELDAADDFGEEVVDGADEAKDEEAGDGHHDWHPEAEDAAHDSLHVSPALREDDGGGDPVDEAEEKVEDGDDLAALQDGDAGDLFFHGSVLLRRTLRRCAAPHPWARTPRLLWR